MRTQKTSPKVSFHALASALVAAVFLLSCDGGKTISADEIVEGALDPSGDVLRGVKAANLLSACNKDPSREECAFLVPSSSSFEEEASSSSAEEASSSSDDISSSSQEFSSSARAPSSSSSEARSSSSSRNNSSSSSRRGPGGAGRP